MKYGMMLFSNNNFLNGEYKNFMGKLTPFNAIHSLMERVNDDTQWNEYQDERNYAVIAKFKDEEVKALVKYDKYRFTTDMEWMLRMIVRDKGAGVLDDWCLEDYLSHIQKFGEDSVEQLISIINGLEIVAEYV